jgi:ABC-type iron transport system FetAB ATPase subunit
VSFVAIHHTGAPPLNQLRIEELQTHDIGPINLVIEAGECVVLSGPSGSGKTLLLRAIADLDLHTGSAYLENKECKLFDSPQWRAQVGMLAAESQWWYERIGEHFKNKKDIPQLSEWLSDLGFDDSILNRQVAQCSTGERQRMALLRLLQNQPKVLLLDEPTASLDPENVQRVEKLINRYRQKKNASVLWTSHDMEQIKRVASRHIRLENGKIKDYTKP